MSAKSTLPRLGATVWLLTAACAQPPTQEILIAADRVARAEGGSAALFAPELLAEAQEALAEAQRLVETKSGYRGAVRAAAQACLRADEAFSRAIGERRVVEVRLDRLEKDIEGLLEMASSRGAREQAPSELEAITRRFENLAAIEADNLLEAYEEARRLKPEALALEQRFRPENRLP